jgi:hypothetical protein
MRGRTRKQHPYICKNPRAKDSVARRLKGGKTSGVHKAQDVRDMHQTFGVAQFWTGDGGEPAAELFGVIVQIIIMSCHL